MDCSRDETAQRQTTKDQARCDTCPTRKVCVAAALDPAERALVPTVMSCSAPIDRGEYLFRTGDRATQQLHVRSGMVKTYVVSASGDEWVTGLHLPGDVVGLAQADGAHLESAVALDAVSVCALAGKDLECLENFPRALVRHLAGQWASRQRQLLHLRQSSADVRLAAFCVDYSARLARLGRDPTYLPMPMSRTDLASFLGLALASLSRLVAKFDRADMVRAGRHAIEIRAMDALRAVASPALI